MASRHTFIKFGGDEENRTPDPLLARQVLSQLSYAPMMLPGFLHFSENPVHIQFEVFMFPQN